jgi:hypothetical protein
MRLVDRQIIYKHIIMNKSHLGFLQDKYMEICVDIESHNYMSNFWNNTHIYIGIPTTLLSSLVTASIFSNLSNGQIIVGCISLLITALSALSTFLNPTEKYLSHKTTKSSLISLRDKAKIFIDSILENQEIDKEELKEFKRLIEQIYSNKPQVPEWVKDIAIKRVRKMQKLQLLNQ